MPAMKKILVINMMPLIFSILYSTLVIAGPGVGEKSDEFWVDGPAEVQPGDIADNPDVAIDSSGRSIFVWSSFISTRYEIYLRVFDASHSPLGDPVLVNTLTEDDQNYPRVAVSSDDSFLVVWQSDEPDSNTGFDSIWVRSQAFDAAGNPDGDEQLVSSHPTGEGLEVSADVAALRDGGYIVVWRSRDPLGDSALVNIWARRIGADGVPLADPFVVNSTIGQKEEQPAVTELSDGGFLVAWARPDIHGRRFMADGTPVGQDFQIDTFIGGFEGDPDAVLGSDGRVLVVWRDELLSGVEKYIRARIFSDKLVPQGNDFAINTLLTGLHRNPKGGDYGRAGFFVVWDSEFSVGDDSDEKSIQGRIVTGANQFDGAQFQVNDSTAGHQETPGIGGRNDRIGIAWRSWGVEMPYTIVGQSWSVCGIFCDGFEGGDD